MRMISEDQKRTSDFVLSWLGVLGAITAAVFSSVQYLDAKQKDRVDRVLSYLERYGAAEMIGDRRLVELEWDKLNGRIRAIPKGSTEEVAQQYNRLVLGHIDANANLNAAVVGMLEFFEELSLCAQADICDRRATLVFLGREGRAFFRAVYPYVCWRREMWSSEELYAATEQVFNPGTAGMRCSPVTSKPVADQDRKE